MFTYVIKLLEQREHEAIEATRNYERANSELLEKMKELEKMNKLMVGRELDMIELKKEINRLLAELGRPKKYEV
jgi:inhibitor of KinA sporulation pathway (predicted exonuclease)